MFRHPGLVVAAQIIHHHLQPPCLKIGGLDNSLNTLLFHHPGLVVVAQIIHHHLQPPCSKVGDFGQLPKYTPVPPSGPSRGSSDYPPPPPTSLLKGWGFGQLPKYTHVPPSGPSRGSSDYPPPPPPTSHLPPPCLKVGALDNSYSAIQGQVVDSEFSRNMLLCSVARIFRAFLTVLQGSISLQPSFGTCLRQESEFSRPESSLKQGISAQNIKL
ncbi:hypothetical protein OIU77_030171 [Salix suchowensis]|uniref:Uncharacterized protein n=1 Tax=Salix suchowensis TaxID=1278906 RepID=A0ABQ9BCS8_9ROSI|nr:hypothetical protein OIU77_030171 [Salix suchowensis]